MLANEGGVMLLPNGGVPDLNKIVRFLETSKADDHTLRVMRHWSHDVDNEKASVETLVGIVLGRDIKKGQRFPVPWVVR